MKKDITNKRILPYSYFNATTGLIVLNVGLFLLTYLFNTTFSLLQLNPRDIYYHHHYWQFFSYMFVHGSVSHLVWNLLGLYMFGLPLEKRIGSGEFLLFYLLAGVFTGVACFFAYLSPGIPLVGASGAIYAILLGFTVFFPDTVLMLFFVIPVKAPVGVLIFIGITLVGMFFGFPGGISHLGHLAGLIFGFFFVWLRYKINPLKIFFR